MGKGLKTILIDFKHVIEIDNNIYKNVCISIIVYIMDTVWIIVVFSSSTYANDHTPLHVTGHMTIGVALVEESNVDINQRGGDKRDTPLMLSVSVLI